MFQGHTFVLPRINPTSSTTPLGKPESGDIYRTILCLFLMSRTHGRLYEMGRDGTEKPSKETKEWKLYTPTLKLSKDSTVGTLRYRHITMDTSEGLNFY